jgi:hypothetical protein
MKRIHVTNEEGILTGWFDSEKAVSYSENTTWNGSNHISKATGSQTEHECLYVTKGKKFILNSWSQWQGTTETYIEIGKQEAAEWLVRNDYQDIPSILEAEVAQLEMA